jgi:hypothetical protein
LHQLLQIREAGFQAKYDAVFAFIKLKREGVFWFDFGFNSLDELLVHLDLPNGSTLGVWEVLVRLFDRDTFLLVGPDILGYMTLLVSKYQPDLNNKLLDYEQIFNNYCKTHQAFDKKEFEKILHGYINRKYIESSGTKVGDIHKRPSKQTPVGVHEVRVLTPVVVKSSSSKPEIPSVKQAPSAQYSPAAITTFKANGNGLEQQPDDTDVCTNGVYINGSQTSPPEIKAVVSEALVPQQSEPMPATGVFMPAVNETTEPVMTDRIELKQDFVVKQVQCGGCKHRDQKIESAMKHIQRLEEIIRTTAGPGQVPTRPKILDVKL